MSSRDDGTRLGDGKLRKGRSDELSWRDKHWTLRRRASRGQDGAVLIGNRPDLGEHDRKGHTTRARGRSYARRKKFEAGWGRNWPPGLPAARS